MNYKDIRFGDTARTQMVAGINILADAVKATLGPKGRNVIIKRKFNGPHVTKDGVSVAKQIHLRDEFMDMGAQLVFEAANQTNINAGDGTTTSTVLAQAIINEGIRYIDRGIGSVDIKRGIDLGVTHLVELLKKNATPINGEGDLIKIAKISANSDPVIADLITKALDAVGADGVISAEKGGYKDELEIVSGMRTDSGWLSSHFVNVEDKMLTEFEKPYIVLVDKELNSVEEVTRLLNILFEDKRPCLLVAHGFSDDVISFMAINNKKGVIRICPVKASGYGDRRTAILEDIAIYTNAVVLNTNDGSEISGIVSKHMGSCDKIIVGSSETSIIGKYGSDDDIQKRVKRIRMELEEETSQYAKDRLTERLATLTRGAAIIHVGGYTEAEMIEKKDRVDDAVCAVRASLEEGYLPGGGIALLRLAETLDNLKGENEDQQTGIKILQRAIKAPFYQIATNAGKNGEVIEYKVLCNTGDECFDIGYNAATDEIVSMVDVGIVDPAKVTRVALQNAASIAGIFLTTEVAIGWDGEDKTDNLGFLNN